MNSASENFRKKGITIFASGAGSNAENCIKYFRDNGKICVNLIVSNKPAAGVVGIAGKYQIPVRIVNAETWKSPEEFASELKNAGTDLILLAGYLSLLPEAFIRAFEGPILNIHPALLPKYGGKGMFGRYVHSEVIKNKEAETGITIHEVDAEYDNGKIIFQKNLKIEKEDTAESIEKKVRELEYFYLPRVIEELLSEQK